AQPSTLLFPVIFLILEVTSRSMYRPALRRFAILCCGVILVVAPWTVRNYLVLGIFVPVSVTGGISLYMGNNPQATGGFVTETSDFLMQFDETSANRVGRELARSWMRQHPGEVVRLAFEKHILFLGDDSVGAYMTLRRGLKMEGAAYFVFKGICT